MNEFYVHDTAIVDKNSTIGDNTKVWHFSHVQSNVSIGMNCTLGQNVNVGSNVNIGNYVKIQNNVSVYEGVTLEDYVFCGPSCVFTNVLLPRCEFPQRGSEFYSPTIVKKSASIGANATVICGNTIGEYALIGAGAVVTKDVPSFALVLGNPAKIVSWVNKEGKKIIFNENNISKCGNYELDNINNVVTFVG
jgi:UDP-2-acetamido-3-amino-2,3-dideoxy-glucuronate N-acetyltransferase